MAHHLLFPNRFDPFGSCQANGAVRRGSSPIVDKKNRRLPDRPESKTDGYPGRRTPFLSPGASARRDGMRPSLPGIYGTTLVVSIVANQDQTPFHSTRSFRFIVADGDRRVCARLQEIIRLESETWRVRTTRFGREALRVIRAEHVDVAILNIDLPDLSGLEVMRAVGREFIRTDFIILTETDCFNTAVRVMKDGARDVLLQPVAKDDLVSAIHEVLERRYPPRREIVCRIDVYLKAHLSNPSLSRAHLCMHFGVSPAYVSRIFSNRVGASFRSRLRYHRIERAKQMLLFTRDPLYVIAEQCGFKSPGRFSEAFRLQEGTTPVKYRMQWLDR